MDFYTVYMVCACMSVGMLGFPLGKVIEPRKIVLNSVRDSQIGKTGTSSLVGYNCNDSKSKIGKIDLWAVPECNTDSEDNSSIRNGWAQIIQKKKYEEVTYQTCLISITRVVYFCSWDQEVSQVSGGHYSYVQKVSKKACEEIHKNKVWEWNSIVATDLQENSVRTLSAVLAGTLTSGGWCRNADSYSDQGGSYTDVFVQADISITLTTGKGDLILDEGKVILTSDNLECESLEEYCFDAFLGVVIWIIPDHNCFGNVDVLHEGEVEIYTSEKNGVETKIVSVKSKENIFAVNLGKAARFCGALVYETEHKRIVVSMKNDMGYQFRSPTNNIYQKNVDMSAYINSKFLYVVRNIFKNSQIMFNAIRQEACETRRLVLQNRQALARIDPNFVSQLFGGRPGVFGRVMGEVLYIMDCTPTMVIPRDTENCYQEIPVLFNNKTKFLTPVTRIIVDQGEEVDCLSALPVLHKIGNHWVGRSPKPFITTGPSELDPNIRFEHSSMDEMFDVSSLGLYSSSDLEKLQSSFLFPTVRKAISTTISRRAYNSDTGTYSIGDIMNRNDLKQLGEGILSSLSPGLIMYAIFGGAIFLSLLSLRVLIKLIGIIANCKSLSAMKESTSGCWRYFMFLGALCDSVTHMIVGRWLIDKERSSTNIPLIPVHQDPEAPPINDQFPYPQLQDPPKYSRSVVTAPTPGFIFA